ncbi:MAG: fibronectin type III domain-containing protein [Deltaproteobacteria bacterium]|nr:fibronectin type III domain-containing protein [Candidatus Anaeroferrophillacea bacterium]
MVTISRHRPSIGNTNHRPAAAARRLAAFLVAMCLLLAALPALGRIPAPRVQRAEGGAVTVSWKAVTGAAGYRLLYGPSSGVYGEPLDVGAVLSHALTTLQGGQNWYFAVSSYDAAGAAGERSAEAGLAAGREVTCASVSLAWDPSESPGVVGYLLYYGPASGTYYTPLDVGNRTDYTVPGLSGCLTWYFTVAAYDRYDNRSNYSNEVVKAAVETTDTPDNGTSDTGTTGKPVPPGQAAQTTGTSTTGANVFTSDSGAGSGTGGDDPSTISAVAGIAAVESGAAAPAVPGNLVAGTEPWPADGGWLTVMPGSPGSVPEPGRGSARQLDWADYNAANGESRVATGDLDGDGKNEIVIGFGPAAGKAAVPNGYFQVLDDDGTLITWGQVGWPDYNAADGETWPSTADLDGDGIDEIIIGFGPGGYGGLEVFALENGAAVHRSWLALDWPEYAAGNGSVRPTGADLDGDGVDEIVAGLGPVTGSPDLPGGAYAVLHGDGYHSWGQLGWQDYAVVSGEVFPAAGDLNNDGSDEIVLGLGDGGAGFAEIQQYRPEESAEPVHCAWLEAPWQDELPGYRGATHPAVGNLDSDPEAEIALGLGTGGGGWVHLYNQETHTLGVQLWPMLQDSGFHDQAGGSWVAIHGQ